MNGVCLITVATLAVTLLVFVQSPAVAAVARESDYRGWKTVTLTNGIIELHVAPEIGGRIIQFKLSDFEYLWVNEQLAGKSPLPGGVGPNGEWLNYGGDKLWPAPQGWRSDAQWPGPPDPVLDGSPHKATVLTDEGSSVAVKLVSGEDRRTGIQFSRVITVFDNVARGSVDATMTNVARKPIRWGVWSNTQLNAGNRRGEGYNENMWAYCPMNPTSIFPKKYNVMFGLVNNPSYKPDYESGMLRVHYERLIGKVGVDCSAGWTAVVDGTDGYVFVQRFTYFPDREYTDGASVEIWMDGVGKIYTGDNVWEGVDDPLKTPYVLESEVLSPYAKLEPGESYTYHYDWYAARIGGNLPILGCTDVGVTCEPFAAHVSDGRLALKGRFGVFCTGTAKLVFYDASGAELATRDLAVEMHPARPLALGSTADIAVPAEAVRVRLVVADANGRVIGELGRAQVQR